MPETHPFYDKDTATLTYVVWDVRTQDAVVIDPVWDYDPSASQLSDRSVQAVLEFLGEKRLSVHYILETHAHADHISGAQKIKSEIIGSQIAIGQRIVEVQKTFKDVYDLPETFATDGSQFDKLIRDNEVFNAGSIAIKAFFTPGHTPACCSYLIGDAVFTGDALFMPDYGTGRCDFPGGSAEALYDSITQRLYQLPEKTRVFTGHDYLPGGRALKYESTIADEKSFNVHLKATTLKEDYLKFRTERDRTLSTPKLLLASLQINIDAGRLPPVHPNGKNYLTIPISE
jgi:glyoxylase-like metal-dependent hydrolase (beta-lactamase superfamily II)